MKLILILIFVYAVGDSITTWITTYGPYGMMKSKHLDYFFMIFFFFFFNLFYDYNNITPSRMILYYVILLCASRSNPLWLAPTSRITKSSLDRNRNALITNNGIRRYYIPISIHSTGLRFKNKTVYRTIIPTATMRLNAYN